MSKLSFNKIVIFESLRIEDRKTGKQIFDDIQYLDSNNPPILKIEYIEISTKHDLLLSIDRLCDESREGASYPIIQFDAHGAEHGIELSSGETITWYELIPPLQRLNIIVKCNLLLVMATCYSLNIVSSLSVTDKAPFWGVITSQEEILPDQIYSSMYKFYQSIINGNNNAELLESLRLSDNNTGMLFITSEWLFIKIYKSYVTNYCNDSDLKKRAKKLRKQTIKEGNEYPPNVRQIKAELKPTKNHFFNCIHKFFMVDLYPENINKISSDVRDGKAIKNLIR